MEVSLPDAGRAVDFLPAELHFGRVRLGTQTVAEGVLSSASSDPISTGLGFLRGEPGLEVRPRVELPAFGSELVQVVWTPQRLGPLEDRLRITGCGADCPLDIEVVGEAVAEGVSCSSVVVGEVGLGECRPASILCRPNVDQALRHTGTMTSVSSIRVSTPAGQSVPPEGLSVNVLVCGAEPGPIRESVRLSFDYDGTFEESVEVPVQGNVGGGMRGCGLVAAGSVDFGALSVGATQSRTVRLVNRGTDICRVSFQSLAPDVGFSYGGPRRLVVAAGDAVDLEVGFEPRGIGPVVALVTFDELSGLTVTARLTGTGVEASSVAFRVVDDGVSPPVVPVGRSLVFPDLDDSYAEEPLPFGFSYLGRPVTSVYVSTNGLIAFSPTGADAYSNRILPSMGTPTEFVAWFWDDLTLELGSSGVTSTLEGRAPNRRLVLGFRDVQRLGRVGPNSTRLSARIELHESTNEIVVHYGEAASANGITAPFSATMGWLSQSGTDGGDWGGCGNQCQETDWPAGRRYRLIPN